MLEEVLADEKLAIRLEKQKKALLPVVEKYNLLKKLEKQKELLSQNEKIFFQNEIEKNIEQTEELKTEILSLLANQKNEFQNITLEIQSVNEKSKKLCTKIFEIYKNFCENENLSFNITACKKIDGMIDNVVADILGKNAFDLFLSENGVHKCENQSVLVLVYPTVEKHCVEFDENSVKVDIYHSNGAGGQNVNNVATAVRITHLKTGVVATCQDQRSQYQNKTKAMENLKEKVSKLLEKNFEKERKILRKKYLSKDIVKTYIDDKNIIIDNKTKKEYEFSVNGLSKMLKTNLIRR